MRKYPTEQIDFLRDNIAGRSYSDMTIMFNERFGLSKTVAQIKSTLKNYGLKNGRGFTQEQIEFVRDNITGTPLKEMTSMFNQRFGTAYPQTTITPLVYRYGFKNGRDTRLNEGYKPTQFKPGHTPANKGTKGFMKPNKTSFQKGQTPLNHRPVGSERIENGGHAKGYTMVKVAEPNKWKMKHVLVWEKANGAVPKGHCVIFANGDNTDFSLDNLLLVTRSELARMNQKGLIYPDADLTKTGHAIAKLEVAMGERKRKTKRSAP